MRSSGQVLSCPLYRDEAQVAVTLKGDLRSYQEDETGPGLPVDLAASGCGPVFPQLEALVSPRASLGDTPRVPDAPGVWHPDTELHLLFLILVVTASRTGGHLSAGRACLGLCG